ncbi:type III-B CRISPR module RAMP protein Cmr1 [Chloroflexus sp.]|uniref:type III-B CRISPR module RAMP protein Cmr1 n=1 Tax=Chloroflexus sp. TaxID=1904827 RepID=UPI003D0B42D6
MELTISTLTPLWTGGIETGKVDRIHETGILGSLRWWYEAIVRGLGGRACDPSKGECRFDAEKYEKHKKSTATDERQRLRDAGLCDVCQLFGATGWRRRFRLAVVADKTQPDPAIRAKIQVNRTYTRNKKQITPTWYFPNNQNDQPRSGTFTLRIQSLAPNFQPEIIAGLVQFIADWAAIGARAQMGFGVIKLERRIDTTPFYNQVVAAAGTEAYPRLPSLKNIFLARISPKNGGTFSDQDTFNLKYDLRRLFANDQALRHFIMGTIKDQRIAAKVKMSRPYNMGQSDDQEMRVWGWIPEEADVYQNSWNRDSVVDAIYQHLRTNYTLTVWREMNSARDSVKPDLSDTCEFLRSLL